MNVPTDFRTKIQELQQEHATVEKRRKVWLDLGKYYLTTYLDSVSKRLSLDWIVSQNNDTSNLEAVALAIPNRPSGIKETVSMTDGSFTATNFVKVGGYLNFSQTVDGHIVILVVYPYIRGVTSQKPFKVIGYVEPEKLDEGQIETFVLKFVDEMIKWETDQQPLELSEPIGFKFAGKSLD